MARALVSLVVVALVGLASANTCEKTCVSVNKFETNTDPALWEGPTSGTIEFCKNYVDWSFCPIKADFANNTYLVSEMDTFAEDYFKAVYATHDANCDSSLAFNQCAKCEVPLELYACMVAFQPCTEGTTTFTPACNSVCKNVASSCTTSIISCNAGDTPFLMDSPSSPTDDCSAAGAVIPTAVAAIAGAFVAAFAMF